MKKALLIIIVLVAGVFYKPATAQVNVNINIGAQPVWGPVGYDYVEYYFMPDIGVYYYVPTRQFIYLANSKWMFATTLPYRYRGYNIYTGYKVVINEPRPYLRFNTHKVAYAKYKGNSRQVIIKNSSNPKYYVVKGHPKYNGGKGVSGAKKPGSKSKSDVTKAGGNKGKGSGKGKS